MHTGVLRMLATQKVGRVFDPYTFQN